MTTPPQQNSEPNVPDGNDPQGNLPAWATRNIAGGELSDVSLAAFIGPRWERSYRKKFATFRADASFVPTWNWSAAFGMPFWFLYRKLYLAFGVFFVLPGVAFRWLTGTDTVLTLQNVQLPENQSLLMMNFAIFASAIIAAGGTGNWLLFRRARAATKLAQLQRLPDADAQLWLARIGGVNRGGTLLFCVLSLVLAVAQVGA